MHQYKITSALCVKYKQETEYDHKTMKYMKANEDKNVFLSITRFLFRARILFFLAWQQKNFFSPIGIFGTRNFTF